MKRYARWLIMLLVWTAPILAAPRDLPKISARAWVMMDANSGYILSANNQHLPLHPGDLTKLMTGYVLFKSRAAGSDQLEHSVTIDDTVQRTNGPRIFLQANETISVDKLISAMLVHAANDATLSLAKILSGTEKEFVKRMNRQARVLGMTRTRFSNATGLPDIQQASTAADLALLAQAINNQFPQYQDFFRTRKIRHHGINYYNRNAMLWRDADIIGLMASPNPSTGYHVVATTAKEDQNLIVVVMGAKSEQRLFEAAQALLDYGRRTWETKLLYPAHKVLAEIPVDRGNATTVPIGTLDNLYATLPKGTVSQLEAKLEIEPKLAAPIEKGQEAGNLTLMFGDKVLAEHPLVALRQVKVGNALQQTWGDFRNWLRGNPDGSSGNTEGTQE